MARTCLPISRTLTTLPAHRQVVLLLYDYLMSLQAGQLSWVSFVLVEKSTAVAVAVHWPALNDILQIVMLNPQVPPMTQSRQMSAAEPYSLEFIQQRWA